MTCIVKKIALEDNKVSEENLQVKEVFETSTGLEPKDWWFLFIDYVLYDTLPDDLKEAATIKRKAHQFYYNAITWISYRWSYDEILLCYLLHKEAHEALREAYEGMCGAHQLGPKLGDRLRRLGYYWLKLISNAIAYARWCDACQIHSVVIHQAPWSLHPTSSSWPFEMWGMDVIEPISPSTSKEYRFILPITDYFLKWAEAIPPKE